jgi:tungstate transport system substrate-binding protein
LRRTLAPLCTLLALAAVACAGDEPETVILATTTSVQDSGLLDAILPRFTRESGIRVRSVAVGTGAALRMGKEGNADLLLTHAPAAERELVSSGALASRVPIMQNYFVIAGPPEDPAGAGEATSAAEAFLRIRAAEPPYVSRGDDSGTHRRELELWRLAGIDPDDRWPGFASTGSGMGLSLQVAGERRAYLLSDFGTFLAFRERTGLVALSHPEPGLRNVYSLLRVDPERFRNEARGELARRLEAFFLRHDVQERIGEFGLDRFGEPLFHPLHAVDTGGERHD